MLTVGDKAPAFQAVDQNGTQHSLASYAGAWLAVYFYPKDDTPGCTKQACSIRDSFDRLAHRVTVLGVSADSEESHRAFAAKYALPFPLLIDADRTLIESFGADGTTYPKRTTFLINPDGVVSAILTDISVEEHADEILAHVPSDA